MVATIDHGDFGVAVSQRLDSRDPCEASTDNNDSGARRPDGGGGYLRWRNDCGFAHLWPAAGTACCAAFGTAPLACKASISIALKPSCARTSSLCSPSDGARFAGTFVTPCT